MTKKRGGGAAVAPAIHNNEPGDNDATPTDEPTNDSALAVTEPATADPAPEAADHTPPTDPTPEVAAGETVERDGASFVVVEVPAKLLQVGALVIQRDLPGQPIARVARVSGGPRRYFVEAAWVSGRRGNVTGHYGADEAVPTLQGSGADTPW